MLINRNGQVKYTDAHPGENLMSVFKKRGDNQIVGLEMLAIGISNNHFHDTRCAYDRCVFFPGLGLSTFHEELQGQRVVIWSDNTAAECAIRKGSARSFDHTCITHCIWTYLTKLKTEVIIRRVPTKDNIADLPSREEYTLLKELGAEFVLPRLDSALKRPTAWESLSLVQNKVLPSGGGAGQKDGSENRRATGSSLLAEGTASGVLDGWSGPSRAPRAS